MNEEEAQMISAARWISVSCLGGALLLAGSVPAAAQAKPNNATAQCKDGSYSQAKTERGACSGHGGVGTWYGAAKAEPAKGKDPGSAAKTEARTTAPAAKAGTPNATAAPAGTTGRCQDGTFTKAKTERGACSGHGGVATWTGAAATAAPPAAPTRPAAPPPAPPVATAKPPATAQPSPSTAAKPSSTQIQAPPAGAPENATAQCNDGTFSMAKQHRGACSGHKGVKAWFK